MAREMALWEMCRVSEISLFLWLKKRSSVEVGYPVTEMPIKVMKHSLDKFLLFSSSLLSFLPHVFSPCFTFPEDLTEIFWSFLLHNEKQFLSTSFIISESLMILLNVFKHEIEGCVVLIIFVQLRPLKPEFLCVGRTHWQKGRMTDHCGKAGTCLNLSKCHDQIKV